MNKCSYMKRRVDYHPSVLIAQSEMGGEFLFSIYDDTYPRAAYRGAANLIGGNPTRDNSPLETLSREIGEEFNFEEALKVHKICTSSEEIDTLRDSLIYKVKPFADFYIRVLKEIPRASKPYSAIYSAYNTTISQKIFEMTRQNLKQGRKMVGEGLLGILGINDLKSGRITAHGTPFILGAYLNLELPHFCDMISENIGTPREKYKDYEDDFEYGRTATRVEEQFSSEQNNK